MPIKEDTGLIYELAEKLCGRELKDVSRAGAGANSRIFRIRCGNQYFALKFYRPRHQSLNDRRETEASALKFLERCGMRSAPRLISTDAQNNCSLLEWIDGKPVDPVDDRAMAAATDFFTRLYALKDRPEASRFAPGTEACLCGEELARQLRMREGRLQAASRESRIVKDFVDQYFSPTVAEVNDWAKRSYAALGLDFAEEIDRQYLTLSPVDFGFHNALRREDGRIVFFDFEYFGWVDTVNVVADTVLHPGMSLSENAKEYFYKKMSDFYEPGFFFKERLKILYPMYGLRWCAIMMNQFLPGYVASNMENIDEEEKVRLNQEKFKRVENKINRIRNNYKDFPYAS